MIEYDYEIVRTDENTNEIEIFKPNKIPAKLPNLVSIEAPNSSGKSTLLSIIALSFFGNKNNKLHPSLVKQINSLLHSTRDNLIFKIKVTNSDSTIEIISEKKDGGKIDIIVHEISDGKKIILTPELLERKYNLIYDIPDNPTERLSKLTDEVKNSQMRYGNDVRALNGHIKNIILDIRNSKNPDRLKDLNQKHNDLLNETNDLDDLVKSFQNELDLLEFAVYDQFFNFYSMRYDFKNKELNKEKRKVKKVINAKNNSNNELRGKTIEIKNTLLNIQKIFDATTLFLKKLIPKKESHHLKIWELIDINQTVDTLEFDENLLQEISHFSSILNEMHADISNKSEYQEIKLYTDLINILDHYRTINIKIPGLEKPMNEFVDDLQEMVRSNQKEIIFDENCNQTIELLNNLRQEIKLAQLNILPDLKILRRLHSNDVQNDNYNDTIIESKIKDLNSDLKLYYDRMQYYQAELLKKGTYDSKTICEIGKGELEKYSVYTEEQLRNEIAALKDEITNKKTISNKNKYGIERLSKAINDIEKKKPHEYYDYLDQLEQLESITTILSTKLLNQFNSYISDINTLHNYNNITDEQKKYYKFVFSYLGSVLGEVRHLDKTYSVKCIDLIEEKIITHNGKTILFAEMGTGQSQSAYIMSLLNNSDNRKIIALFDEISMMDNNSLKPIYEKMRELYEQNKLLLGIVVQRLDQEVNITPI